jgi:ABC-type Fe3+ transport system permease subunit
MKWILIGGFVFVVSVFLLQYLIRSGTSKPDDKRWAWDKADTATLAIALVVALVGGILAFVTLPKSGVVVPNFTPQPQQQPIVPLLTQDQIMRSEMSLPGL